MSAFTALNGGSPKTAEPPSAPSEPTRAGSADRVNGLPSIPEPKAPSSSVDPPAAPREGSWAAITQDRPSYQQSSTYAEVDASHKRKRSNSLETPSQLQRSREAPVTQERTPDTATQPTHPEARDIYGTPEMKRRPYTEDSRDHGDSWYSRDAREDRGYYDQHHSMASPQRQSDEHMGDRRADSQMDNGSDYGNTSPDAEERSIVFGPPYIPGQRDPVLQSDPKKRKRNFSNRTKTGCLTCRKRKKKCDETKPECANCVRGGFLCAGYPPQRGAGWQKPENKIPAIPLESKDPSYVPPGAYGMPQTQQQQQQQQQQNPYSSQPGVPQRRETLPPYRGQALRIDPPQGRPLVTDDDRPTASTIPSASVTSPDNKLSALSSYTPGNVFPTPVSAQGPPQAPFSEKREYSRVPPLHDLSRTEPETPHPGNTLPQINILHPTRTNSPAPQPSTSNAQVAAQLALSHTQFSSGRPRTQKEEMLSGRHYYPFDKELVLERERCSAACWRFNNSTNPNNGVSPTERARLFREILQPRDPIQISPTFASPVTNIGRVGESVVVEAPFTCDYGYNISIGQNVLIGRNCTIIDTCEVKIGDNCHIGPNVSIYTATLPIDPKRRMGSKGPQLGRAITIESDCWIGGGAIILPGRTIGKGSTVGAGAIVTKDVPPFTIVVGNPARVLRGISS